MRKSWILACKRKDKFNLGYARVCEDHFPQDVIHTTQCRLTTKQDEKCKSKCKIPAGTIPTLNLPITNEEKVLTENQLARNKRAERRIKTVETQSLLLKQCRRDKFNLGYARVCEDHFPRDVIHTTQCRLTTKQDEKCKSKCNIPAGTIPTLNLPNTNEEKVLTEHQLARNIRAERRIKIVETQSLLLKQCSSNYCEGQDGSIGSGKENVETTSNMDFQVDTHGNMAVDTHETIAEENVALSESEKLGTTALPIQKRASDTEDLFHNFKKEKQLRITVQEELVTTKEILKKCVVDNMRTEQKLLLSQQNEKEAAEKLNDLHKYIKMLEEKLQTDVELESKFEEVRKQNELLENEKRKLLELLKQAKIHADDTKVKEELERKLKNIFTPGQMRALLSGKRVRWNAEDITPALALHSLSVKAYKYLRNSMNVPLPCVSTLRRWTRKLPCDPGIQHDILNLMKMKSDTMMDHEKIVVLTFDEMSIMQRYCYDISADQVVGPHASAQVLMMRSLYKNWKQVVYYGYDTPMTPELFLEIVKAIHESGYHVKLQRVTSERAIESKFEEVRKQNELLENEKRKLLELLKQAKIHADDTKVKEELERKLKNIFTPGQMRALLSGKRVRWNAEDITPALALHSLSAKAYKYLRNSMNVPLPCVSTLRRWTRKLPCDPGIQHDILNLMKMKSDTMMDHEKIVVLTFDEMSIMQRYCYDISADQVVGPHASAQVLMMRSLYKNWKQVVYYGYDTPMTPELFLEIVKAIHESGYHVVASTSDLGASNRSFLKRLGVNDQKTWIDNPYISGSKIYFFADVPHMLKLMRNHFLDQGFVFNNKLCRKNILYKMLSILNSQDQEIKIAHKLNTYQLEVKGKARQRVATAAKLFSRTNAAALEYFGIRGKLDGENWTLLRDIISTTDQWFDLFNTTHCSPFSVAWQQAYGLCKEGQNKILRDMINIIQTIRCPPHRTMLPFQRGILMSCISLPLLHDELQQTYPHMKYLLTHRLNQDCLENFFLNIRASGITYDNPLPTEFKYRMKRYILGKNPDILSGNCNPDGTLNLDIIDGLTNPPKLAKQTAPTPLVLDENNLYMKRVFDELKDDTEESDDETNDPSPPEETIDPFETELQYPTMEIDDYVDEDDENFVYTNENIPIDCSSLDHEINFEGMKYLGGYIAMRLKEIPGLGNHTSDIEKTSSLLPDWIETLSYGGLMNPTKFMTNLVLEMEKEFIDFNGNEFYRGRNITKKLSEIIVQKTSCNEKISKLFTRTRMFIRIRKFNEE
ncbi:hypothetical protein B566_EDAN018701, partial [Ephemera danica]